MSTLPGDAVIVLSGVAMAAMGVFLWGVHRRWLARFRRGYFYTLFLALAGTSVGSAVLVAVWSYDVSGRLFVESVRNDLVEFSSIVQSEFRRDLKDAFLRANLVANQLGHAGTRDVTVGERVREILELNPRLLQLNVFDELGQPLAQASRGDEAEDVRRVPVAYALDGQVYASNPFFSEVFNEYLLNVCLPIRTPEEQVIGGLSAHLGFNEGLIGLFESARFGETGYAVLVNGAGKVMAHPDPSRIGDDISSYTAVQRGLQGFSGSVTGVNKAGESRIFFFHSFKSPATQNPETFILLTELTEEEATAPLAVLREEFLLCVLILSLGSFAVAQQLAKSLRKPVSELALFAQKVGAGDFSQGLEVSGRDSLGRLGDAFNRMIAGLQERDRVKELFGRYLTTQISEEVLKGDIQLGGVSRPVTMLISDIRGFTSMSEHLDPQQVVSFLNEYFSEMVEAVFDEGGVLDKFLGDGLLAVFGSLGESTDHAHRAVRCALRMKALLAKINGERVIASKEPISIGIGIHTEEVVVGNIGSRKRLEYTVIGDGVNTTSRVESLNKEFGTTVLITDATYQWVKDSFVCRQMPETRLRGKSESLEFYEVISARQDGGGL